MLIIDSLAILLSCIAVHKIHYFPPHEILAVQISTPNVVQTINRTFAYAVISTLLLISSLKNGHYTHHIPWWNQIRVLVAGTVICTLVEGFASFIFHIPSPPLLIIGNWAICCVFIIGFRRIYFYLRTKYKKWNVSTVIAGDVATVTDIFYAFNADPGTGYDIKRVFISEGKNHLNVTDIPRRYSNIHIESFDQFENYIIGNPRCFYVIVPDAFDNTKRDEIIQNLNKGKSRYAITSSLSKVDFYETSPRYFFGSNVMLLLIKSQLSHPISCFMKRTIDIIVSSVLLIFLLPIFFVIILALKMEKHTGSIFYSGERLGKNSKMFKCWKFRTMECDSDLILKDYFIENPEALDHWKKYFKLPHDPRVKTRTAKMLRRISFDEIPQFWNVLIGHMSLVGPRPILPEEAESYGDALCEYIKVKPGITGLWQVSGRNAVSFQRRIYWDKWYVRNWSLWGDIVIMLKTVPAVLFRNDGH